MADPICRWRNSTVKQVCEFSQILPMRVMSKIDAHKLIDDFWFRWDGGNNFFKTPYQLAKQMGLYYEDDFKYYPKLKAILSLTQSEIYLKNWVKKYYVPNPYTSSMSSNGKPKIINSFLFDLISKNGPLDWNQAKDLLFGEEIGNDDILCNLLNSFSDIQIVENIVSIKEGATKPNEPLEVEFDRNDAKAFFYHIANSKVENLIDKDAEKYQSYLTAIRTKPFILLAGISGTGKSRLVRELAFMSCPKVGKLGDDDTTPGNYCMIEVKPNWHDSSELLGYTSGLQGKYIVTPFVKFLVKAMRYPEVPFFVCLDEMNLAPVEQYFAEYLSVLETRTLKNGRIVSGSLINKDVFINHEDIFESLGLKNEERTDLADELVKITAIENELKEFGLRLPQNLIVVGTVNMDDTTHQFSRKVIDRAMTFEMNHLNFNTMFEEEDRLTYTAEPLDATLCISDCVNANEALDLIEEKHADSLKAATIALMQIIDEKLKDTPFRVAYRVQNELVLYYRNLLFANSGKSFDELFPLAADALLTMKVLPRIEGDEDMVKKPLEELDTWTAEKGYTTSNAKIKEMLLRLDRSHYTSYWP